MRSSTAASTNWTSTFAMLIPPFAGQPMKAYDKAGEDITAELFAPNGFMKVDADYKPKPYEDWSKADWPNTYQTPKYKNIFAIGIAFAPPHLISKPMQSANGTPINPAPPRTGMPSAAIGKAVAESIRDMLAGAPSPRIPPTWPRWAPPALPPPARTSSRAPRPP
jgi:sulfide:quinone oxidoreductase